MTPLTHPAKKIDQVDSKIKDVGQSYMFKKKFISKKVLIVKVTQNEVTVEPYIISLIRRHPVGLTHDLAVHMVNFFGWMSQGVHSEPLLLLTHFYQSTPTYSKVRGGLGWWWPM